MALIEAAGGFSRLCDGEIQLTTEHVHRSILNVRNPHVALENACAAVFARNSTAFMELSPATRSAMGCYRWDSGTRFVRVGGPENPARVVRDF